MTLDKDRRTMNELPDEMRRLIRTEVENGLEDLRTGSFESRLRARLRSEEGRGWRIAERRPWRWASVAAAGTAALALVAVAILWLGRASNPSNAAGLVSALGELPGFQAMDRATPDQLGKPAASAVEVSPLLRSFAAAASTGAAGGAGVTAPPKLAARYSLRRKLEILTKEKPIERALQSIKTNLGDV